MNQLWIVGLLVGLAAAYCVWYLLPNAARQKLVLTHRWLGRAPSCGSCSDCDQCAGARAGNAPAVNAEGVQPVTFYPKR